MFYCGDQYCFVLAPCASCNKNKFARGDLLNRRNDILCVARARGYTVVLCVTRNNDGRYAVKVAFINNGIALGHAKHLRKVFECVPVERTDERIFLFEILGGCANEYYRDIPHVQRPQVVQPQFVTDENCSGGAHDLHEFFCREERIEGKICNGVRRFIIKCVIKAGGGEERNEYEY